MASERYAVTDPNVIEQCWSLEQVLDAHCVLDMYEELEAEAARRS